MSFKKIYVYALTLILIFVPLLMLTNSAASGDEPTQYNKTLSFAWEQPAAETSSGDFGGWKIYKSSTTGGPYVLLVTIPFTASNPENTYTTSTVITVPSGSETRLYFVATAFDKAENESAFSNEVNVLIDFKPPTVPINLKITVTTGN